MGSCTALSSATPPSPSSLILHFAEQFISDAAKNLVAMNPHNIAFDAKRLIGCKFDDESIAFLSAFSQGFEGHTSVTRRGVYRML